MRRSKEVRKVHPKNLKNGDSVFTDSGKVVIVYLLHERAGRYTWYTVDDEDCIDKYEYDSHDYTGEGGDILPCLYRKDPTGKWK